MTIEELLPKLEKAIVIQRRIVKSCTNNAKLYFEMNELDNLLGARLVMKRYLRIERGSKSGKVKTSNS
jgi:hypothetical protein